MTGTMAMQWAALAFSALGALARFPGALRGRGRALTVCLLLMTVAMALSLDVFYEPVDAFLGGMNLANLVLRFCLYAIFLILGARSAVAFAAPRSARLVNGPVGWAVLGLVGVLTIVAFVLSDLPATRTGLVGYDDQVSVQVYSTLGRLYPGYVATCVAGSAVAAAFNPAFRPLPRLGAGLIALGLAKVVVFVLLRLTPVELADLNFYLPFCAVIAVTLGLMVLQAVHVSHSRQGQNLLAAINRRPPAR